MSTFTHKTLALLQLASASAVDICDPGAGETYLVHNITLHNTNTTTESVNLLKNNGTTGFKILNTSLASNETLIISWSNDGLILDGSNKLQGYTTTASKVTCDISGTMVV
jgi:hypothetical protein